MKFLVNFRISYFFPNDSTFKIIKHNKFDFPPLKFFDKNNIQYKVNLSHIEKVNANNNYYFSFSVTPVNINSKRNENKQIREKIFIAFEINFNLDKKRVKFLKTDSIYFDEIKRIV